MSRRTEQIRQARLAESGSADSSETASGQHGNGIATDLLPLATPLTDLYRMPGNPRRGDVEAVKRSYVEFGQVKPIVCRRDGMIVAGNHQYLAAQALGWTEMAVVRVDLTDDEAAALNLADNRTSELGTYDPTDLLAMIEQVQEAGDADLLAAISYSDEAIAEIRKALEGEQADPDALACLAGGGSVRHGLD